jgi:tRNA (guanine37-N1)-methyltransferase
MAPGKFSEPSKAKSLAAEAADNNAGEHADYKDTAIVLLSAAGQLFRQPTARRLAQLRRVVLICGRYEGVDERVAEHLATDELSIGDFVLSGGELAAAVVVDAVTRLLPGALGNEASSVFESFSSAAAPAGAAAAKGTGALPGGILDCPHYTRPQVFRGWAVPEVLVSGHHAEVRRWRRKRALEKTLRNRPELLAAAALSEEDRALLEELRAEAAAARLTP